MSIIVAGSVFVDIKGHPEGGYIPGGRNAGRVDQVHGGVARNIAEDIAAAGGSVVFLGLAEDDALGREVAAHLEEIGVDTGHVRFVKDGMGIWLAVFDDRGDVAASISKRPDLRPLLTILEEEGDAIFARADSVLFELDLEEETVEKLCTLAEKHHVPACAAVSNMSIAAERRAWLPKLRCFVCNGQELTILLPGPWEELPPEELAERMPELAAQLGLPCLAVTLGSRGAVWAEGERFGFCPPEPVTVADTAGAGDAFFAGVGLGLSLGRSMETACRLGSRMAGKVIGTTQSVCPPMTAEELGL
jgi:pseudouridine kinase